MKILLNYGNQAWKVKRKNEEEDLDVELMDFFIHFLFMSDCWQNLRNSDAWSV